MKKCKIEIDARFIEDAVFLTVKDRDVSGAREIASSFHREKDEIYEEQDLAKREERFTQFHDGQFSKLGLRALFEQVFDEFPLLDDRSVNLVVRRVFSKKEEGSELYVQGPFKTVALRIQTERISDAVYLKSFLRHELMHASDMFDPQFHYVPDPEFGGANEIEDNLIRDRFRILWNIYVSCRMELKGFRPLIPMRKLRQDFDSAFGFVNEAARNLLFEEVLHRETWTQAELLRFSRRQADRASKEEKRQLCPICTFQTFDLIRDWTGERTSIAEAVRANHPDWTTSDGCCEQCADLYRSRMKVAQ